MKPELPGYAELHCLSNFSFLRGASHAEELVERAKELGYAALALTDECSFAGIVRAHVAAKAAELKLINDPKERAEHVMLIDLARNDIGRIAKIGSVKVTEAFVVERYSHVMHIVSNVEGILNEGMSSMDVLRATFPAGTLTGAPKVHAMELIDQLEPTKRGLYGGACGYLSYAGDMDVAIAIRTAIVKDGLLYVQAAAGVVADSVPELEWKETEHKARALLRAAELVEEGLE